MFRSASPKRVKYAKRVEGKEILLIEDMHMAEETERLEQNLMGINGENGGDNLEDDIQGGDLVISIGRVILMELSRVE